MVKESGKEVRKAKGVKTKVILNEMTYEAFKKANFSGKIIKKKCPNLRSHNHEVFLEETKKIAISPFDDKVVVLEDRIHHLCHFSSLLP